MTSSQHRHAERLVAGPVNTDAPTLAEAAESGRLVAVQRYNILDTLPQEGFNRITRLAARWFHVPIATVTLVDSDRIWFKATRGLDTIAQIKKCLELCDSAIRDNAVYVVNDAANDPRTCNNPLVTGEPGIRFYAAAPITTADGYRLGTVNVIDTQPRDLDEADKATLRDLAAIAADELELHLSSPHLLKNEQQRRHRAEHAQAQAQVARSKAETFASTLQRSLIPPALPHIAGLELAAHYRPASRGSVGGDFYDVFPLPGGRWAITLGDVCGKGASAAALTSFIRYTLRSLAVHNDNPTAVLSELNAALIAEQSLDSVHKFCTAVLVVLTPRSAVHTRQHSGFEVTVTAGGHPPPYLLSASGDVRALSTPGGMLIGMVPQARFVTRTIELYSGDALVLYTDGITEARTHSGEEFGQDRLEAFLGCRTGSRAQDLTNQLAVLSNQFDSRYADDVAVLTLSVPTATVTSGPPLPIEPRTEVQHR